MRPSSRAGPLPRGIPARRRRRPERAVPPRAPRLAAAVLLLALLPRPGAADQDGNIRLHPDTIEARLAGADFRLVQAKDTRFEGDRTQQAMLDFAGSEPMLVKWARAPRGGGSFNNRPRYELAAYRLQRLFLEPHEHVVPPTVVRSFPLAWYRSEMERSAQETFRGTGQVLVVLQYWLWGVTAEGVYDEDRFRRDTLYARHLANLNVFTYLARHNDSNEGNVLLSEDPENPRVFAVDNGLSFDSERSNRGTDWRRLRVDRVPRSTVERLRALTRDRLRRELGVLAQLERRDGRLVAVEPGPNLDPGDGIRRRDGVLQLGLTEGEISDVWERLERLLERVDSGDVDVF